MMDNDGRVLNCGTVQGVVAVMAFAIESIAAVALQCELRPLQCEFFMCFQLKIEPIVASYILI